jgi:3-methyladenine DNA glycosylase AlkD
MTPLDQLIALEDPDQAAGMAAYHKVPRRYLGVPVPQIEALVEDWRAARDVEGRVALARDLWASDIHEARVAAAKLLIQARIRPDDAVWALFLDWLPQFDAWAIADHACKVAERRLIADPSRLDLVETWTHSPQMWTRRAALVATLPWARMNNLKPEDQARRRRILGWAATYVPDRDWFIQKAIAWWVRDLSKHDAALSREFLDRYGAQMKAFARKEAGKYLKA